MSRHRYAILLVCMGNICRSPTAHGVLRHQLSATDLSHQVKVDSAGTHNYHPGKPPDSRSQEHARQRGYDLSDLRARQITQADFVQFDLIAVMDWDNLALTQDMCPAEHQHKIRRLTEFCSTAHHSIVPDPYYGGSGGFVTVLDIVEDACTGLVKFVQQQTQTPPTGARTL